MQEAGQTLGYESVRRLEIRPHGDGSASIDVPALGLQRFFKVKSRGGLVILLVWLSICGLLPFVGLLLARHFTGLSLGEVVFFSIFGGMGLMGAAMILAVLAVFTGGTRTYFRASAEELVVVTQGKFGVRTLRIAGREVRGIVVGKRQEEDGWTLAIERERYDLPEDFLQMRPREELREIAGRLAGALGLEQFSEVRGRWAQGERWSRKL